MSVLDVTRQRTAFTDALRPPPGFVVGACIGTTFSLDFELFTAVLLSFVAADVEEPLDSAPAVLTAVARLRSRLRVLVNKGSLKAPAVSNRLFALYDRVLRPIAIDSGAFHPKVWVLRFDPVARPERHSVEPIYRVLTASRNVTNSGCWELGALFEGTRRIGKQKFGADIAAFFRKIAGIPDLPKALWRLIEELKFVEFAAPREAAQDLRFNWQWPGSHLLVNGLPRKMSRILVISPFLRATFLKLLCDRTNDMTLVSTQDELDGLSDEIHERLATARVFVVSTEPEDETLSMDLHAKLLAWESGDVSETLVGSANATGPGWGSGPNVNCEAMVSLRPGLGIDDVVKAFISPAKDQLQPWIERYNRQIVATDPEQEMMKRLENFKRLLCADQIQGEYDSTSKTLRLFAAPSRIEWKWPIGMCAEIVPLLQKDQSTRADYRLVYGPGAVFQGIDLEDLAAFAYIVVRGELSKDVQLIFVVQFALNLGVMEADARDSAVNARLLEGFDARGLLVDILAGVPGGTSHYWSGDKSSSKQASDGVLRRATIEKILEACTADPSRVHEVEAVLATCGHESNMSTFRNFWSVFRESLDEEDARV